MQKISFQPTQETLLTTETLENKGTTEIELQTPEDKTPVTTTATTYEEKPSKPVDFISENTESKGTNEPATPTTSINMQKISFQPDK